MAPPGRAAGGGCGGGAGGVTGARGRYRRGLVVGKFCPLHRGHMQKGGALVFDDMLRIGGKQRERELALAAGARDWLICDTSPLVTMFYSHDLFGMVDPALARLAASEYAVTFVCMPTIPFVQDGTRRDETFRWRQHAWYVAELERRGVAYTLLDGDEQARVSKAALVLRGSRQIAHPLPDLPPKADPSKSDRRFASRQNQAAD